MNPSPEFSFSPLDRWLVISVMRVRLCVIAFAGKLLETFRMRPDSNFFPPLPNDDKDEEQVKAIVDDQPEVRRYCRCRKSDKPPENTPSDRPADRMTILPVYAPRPDD